MNGSISSAMELAGADHALKILSPLAKREIYSLNVCVLAFDCSDHVASNEIKRSPQVVNDISDDRAKVLWRKYNA
jgi:hypothetical protein